MMKWIMSKRFAVALFVTAISLGLFYISYFQENQEAYLFPAIVTAVVLVFSLISLFRETFGLCVDDIQPIAFLRLIPGLIIMIIAVSVIEELGMYTTSALALFLISFWYSPQENLSKRALSSLLLTVGFMAFMYFLFSVLLGVQTPRGISL